MSKPNKQTSPSQPHTHQLDQVHETREAQVAYRFNKQYRGEAFKLPEEIEAMPIFSEWVSGKLNAKIVSPFWEIAQPQKHQRCLDIGCGVSFLIYPWRDWEAYFYGQEISNVAKEALTARGPQLNSKLFKGVQLGAAHELNYESNFFDLAIATGFSCYFPLSYWELVMTSVKKVLKPNGRLIFDILNPEKPLAEDWAVLETYLGAEVFLEAIEDWEKLIERKGGKIVNQTSGELFQLYEIHFT